MAVSIPSSLNISAAQSTGFASAIQSGITVHGREELSHALMMLESMVVAATVMTSKAAADYIYKESQKHVPYRDGFLHDSAGGGPFLLEGSDIANFGTKATVITSQVEGTVDLETALQVSPGEMWATSVRYGRGGLNRAYAKWAVAYNRDGMAFYATLIHENPMGWEMGQGRGPYPTEPKTSHFLANAFDSVAPYFSNATKKAISNAIDVIHAYALRTAPAAPRALGGPRLVPKGGVKK